MTYIYYRPIDSDNLGLATVYRKQVGSTQLEFPGGFWQKSHYHAPNKNLKRISFKEARTIKFWID